jgi:hypothetical protein
VRWQLHQIGIEVVSGNGAHAASERGLNRIHVYSFKPA